MKGKWVAFSVWLSTFWQQSRAISETGWLPSLPQFCSNEGAVLLKQTGSLEMYLNYLLNPGSLSYLPTNGPVVRHSTLQCHSSLKLQHDEQVRLLHVGKSDNTHSGGIQIRAPSSVLLISRHMCHNAQTTQNDGCLFFSGRYQYLYYLNPLAWWCCFVGQRGFYVYSTVAFVINLPRQQPSILRS